MRRLRGGTVMASLYIKMERALGNDSCIALGVLQYSREMEMFNPTHY